MFCRVREFRVDRRGTGVYHTAMKSLPLLLMLASAQTAPSQKVDIVSVTGCLKESSPSTWMLVNATDPVPSIANAPPAREIPAAPPSGKNEFRLIGVSEFNLPQHKDHVVIVKGLHIKSTPPRLNITSVTTISPSCASPGRAG
jgi:hypothetical protein